MESNHFAISLMIISLGSWNRIILGANFPRLRHTGMKADQSDNLGRIALLAVGVDATTSSLATVQTQNIPPHLTA